MDRPIPTAQQSDATLYPAEPDTASRRRRKTNLGDWVAETRDDDSLPILNCTDQFGKAVLRFGDADKHGVDYCQKL